MRSVLLAVVMLCGALTTVPVAPAADAAAAAPIHSVAVSAAGVETYPAFDPAIERYAVTTSTGSVPDLRVTATTSDRDGVVRVDGMPTTGSRVVSGLAPGDEISVIFTDSGGTSVHSFFVTPLGFPTLDRVDGGSGSGGLEPGHTLLTLTTFFDGRTYETAVDENGVPVYALLSEPSMDFKRQPNGQLTVSRGTTSPGRTGMAMAVLDEQMQEVSRHETVDLVNTDSHDSLLLADGSYYLIAYEPNPTTRLTDAVIQHVSPSGMLLWEWNSADHVDPAAESVMDVATNGDYAHINSIEVMPDGDILASFRHFSSVFKIARTAHDGYADKEIVWKLGGRDSSFSFVDENGDPIPGEGGPCAQHTATVVPGGHILLFDNGAWNLGPLCVNPDDPTGPTVARTPTRVTEYELDTSAGTATPVWNYQVDDRYAIFAGSAQRLDNGNTLVSWASERKALVTEVDPTGASVWELVDPYTAAGGDLQQRRASYRAFRTPVEDHQEPTIALRGVRDGATFTEGATVRPSYACSDRGGSSLQSCQVVGLSGSRLDTRTPGRHELRITATDGAGHRRTVQRAFTVVAAPPPPPSRQPDAAVRAGSRGGFRGTGTIGTAARQTVSLSILRRGGHQVVLARITNAGNRPSRFRLSATPGNRRFAARYRTAGRDRTRAITHGSYRTAVVAPGRSALVKVTLRRAPDAPRQARRRFVISATSTTGPPRRDAVGMVVRARAGRG